VQLPSSWTGKPRAVSSFDLNLISAAQVARALSGQRLDDYRSAEDASAMWGSAQSVEQAQFKAAYWLAVAARVTGRWTLAISAANVQKSGLFRMNIPGETTDPAQIAEVFSEAADQVGRDEPGIYTILRSAADPGRVQIQQDIAQDTSLTQQYIQPLLSTADIFTRPDKWPWYAWVIAALGGMAVLVVVTAPLWAAAGRRAVSRAHSRAREAPYQLRRSLRRIRRRREVMQ